MITEYSDFDLGLVTDRGGLETNSFTTARRSYMQILRTIKATPVHVLLLMI